MKIVAILMASGNSKRFGEDKAFLSFNGKTFIENALDNLINSNIFEIKAVVNSVIFDFLKKNYKKVELIKNTNPHKGQSESIKLGVKSTKNADAFMFCSLDQPLLSTKSINKIIENFEKGKIIVPKYGEKNGLPTIFDKKFKNNLLSIEGDIGGRDIIKNNQNLLKFVKISDLHEGMDIDTKEDYKLLRKRVERT